MKSFEKQIKGLNDACFDIEEQLTYLSCMPGDDNNEQFLRRELYRVRIALGGLKRYAQIVDEERESIKNEIQPNGDENE